MSLTGKTRVRVKTGWFGSHELVLQVEEKVLVYDHPMDTWGSDNKRWRDATVEDLAELSNWKFNLVNVG